MSKVFVDQIPPEGGRKYSISAIPDGKSNITDVTEYIQVGTQWGAADANQAMRKEDYDPDEDGIIAIAQGGTGATTAAGARTSLGVIPATEKGAADGVATLDADTKLTPEQGTSGIVSVTTARALALTDKSNFLTANSESAITVTIPTNATVAFPVGSEIELCQYGVGTLTIIGATDVTVNGVSAGSVQSSERYACIAIKKIGTNEWIAAGGLA